VGRTTCTKDSTVTLKIKVKFNWVNHVAVDNRAGDTISAPVTLILIAWEEANMVSLANDDKGDFGVYPQFFTRAYVNI
jgi:hypothetical protein